MEPTARGQSWDDCDPDIRACLDHLVAAFREDLGEALTGVYLHGSLAMGSYRRAKSDLDVLVVVRERLSAGLRRILARELVSLSDARPTLGDLEVSVVSREDIDAGVYPMPFEVHYSAEWKERLRHDQVDFSMKREDPDLAAHFAAIQHRGRRLYGLPIAEIFRPVAREVYLSAVLDDFDWIVEGEHLLETPIYGVLNVCRTLQLLRAEEIVVSSKEEGGRWALAHLPAEHHPLIRQALEAYRSPAPVLPEERKTAGQLWDDDALRRFRDFARRSSRQQSAGGPGSQTG
jgi:predicted nucleotidyltransferase